MRKTLFLICTMACLAAMPVFAQTIDEEAVEAAESEVGQKKLGIHPFKKYTPLADDFAHWSLSIEGGIDLIDADFVQPKNTIIPKSRVQPQVGLSLEYSFSPTWGLAVSYSYAMYGLKYKDWTNPTLKGQMHLGEVYLTYDFIDAWFPRRQKDIFSVYALLGLGMGVYNCDFMAEDGGTVEKPRANGKYNTTGAIGIGLAAEFNLSRVMALGVKGVYRIYTNDKIDAREKGTNNDVMEYVSMNLRFKLAGRKKNHVRNYASDDMFLSQWADGGKLGKKSAEKDTIVISHMDTIVFSHVDTLVVVDKQQQITQQQVTERMYVYFDYDKANLKESTLNTIQQIASRLQEDSTLYVEILGYCDNTGSEQYNEKLAQRRADAVVSEFVKVYGISKDRFLPVGRGRIDNVKEAYGPNRRVEMLYTTKEDLEARREKYNKEKEEHNKKVEAAPAPQAKVENATPQADDQYIAYVKTQKNVTTLSQLARKYYKNVYCWPYIYAANKDVLENPDYIPEGLTLKIPRLTEKQMDVKDEESMAEARDLAKKILLREL